MKTGKWIFKYSINIIFILFMMCAGTLLIKQYVLYENPPSLLGYSFLPVMSGSMSPTFETGDMIIIKEEANYGKEDVITFECEEGLISHRIVEEVEEGYGTKGDANNVKDEDIIKDEQIKGKYIFVIPWIGSLRILMTRPISLIVILGVMAVCYLWIRQRSLEKEAK